MTFLVKAVRALSLRKVEDVVAVHKDHHNNSNNKAVVHKGHHHSNRAVEAGVIQASPNTEAEEDMAVVGVEEAHNAVECHLSSITVVLGSLTRVEALSNSLEEVEHHPSAAGLLLGHQFPSCTKQPSLLIKLG